MTVLDDPDGIYNLAVLVIAHLLQIQMRGIERLHSRVAIIAASKGGEVPGRSERIVVFIATSTSSCDVDGSHWIRVRLGVATVINGIVVNRP